MRQALGSPTTADALARFVRKNGNFGHHPFLTTVLVGTLAIRWHVELAGPAHLSDRRGAALEPLGQLGNPEVRTATTRCRDARAGTHKLQEGQETLTRYRDGRTWGEIHRDHPEASSVGGEIGRLGGLLNPIGSDGLNQVAYPRPSNFVLRPRPIRVRALQRPYTRGRSASCRTRNRRRAGRQRCLVRPDQLPDEFAVDLPVLLAEGTPILSLGI